MPLLHREETRDLIEGQPWTMIARIITRTRHHLSEVSPRVEEEETKFPQRTEKSGEEQEIGMEKGETENEAQTPLEQETAPSRLAQI
jgi:hypothetical protein